MTVERIMVVAAHPDDDILGCGGMLAKAIKKNQIVRVVFISEGTSCRYPKDEIKNDIVQNEISMRNEFGKKALQKLGISDYRFNNLPCGRLDTIPLIDIAKIVEKEINDFNPDTIFTHSHKDTNNDHRLVFQSVLQATRPNANNFVKRLYSFEILSSSEWMFVDSFKPNYFIELDYSDVQLKIDALSEYVTECKEYPFPRSSEGVMVLAKQRGMQAGVNYAEAFYLIREID